MSTGAPPAPPPRTLQLLTQPSGWDRIKVFGAPSHAEPVRRRSDGIALAWNVAALLVLVPTTHSVSGVEANLVDTIAVLPDIARPLASFAYDLIAVWACVVLVLAVVRRHGRLVVGLLVSALLAVAATVLLNATFDLSDGGAILALGAPQPGVPVQLAVALAATGFASRELTRPFRALTRRLIIASAAGAMLLPVTSPYRVLCTVVVASAVAKLVRLWLGSPRTSLSSDDLRQGLRDLGIEADSVDDDGAGPVAVRSDGGRLSVRAIGREEWETHVLTTLWRFVWYRNSGTTLCLTNREQIEHEAFLVLLAQAGHADVAPVIAAGMSRTGDALMVTELAGTPLDVVDPTAVGADVLAGAWRALDTLHDRGIAHGGVRPAAVLVGEQRVTLRCFERAEPVTRLNQLHADRAQLLATTALVAGQEWAIQACLAAVDPDAAGPLVAHLQSAAMDRPLRDALAAGDIGLAELRAATADRAGIEVPELQKLWRVSWGSILRLLLLGGVGYLLISQLADIGLATIVNAVQAASLPLLLCALVLGQVPRVFQAASLQTASPAPVPLNRVTKLQFATCFVNLAVPSTAARVATSIRFFQRSGATSAGAVSAGAVDSIFGFIAQIGLLLTFALFGFGTLGFDGVQGPGTDRSDLWAALLILLGGVVLVVAVIAVTPKLRQPVVRFLGQMREALTVLRTPSSVVRLLLWNVTAELTFSLTIWTVLRAFGQDVGLPDVILINEAVALFAGLIPVPGGVGVTEGALTTGFVAIGVPQDIAFSAALCYRMCTFYLPPLWGYLAFRSLQRDGYL